MDASTPSAPGTLPVVAAAPAPDTAAFVADAVTAAFGLVALGLEVLVRAATGPPQPAAIDEGARRGVGSQLPAASVVEMGLGLGWDAARIGGRVVRLGGRVAAPVVGIALAPPLVPRALQPATVLEHAASTWRRQRPAAVRELGRWSGSVATDSVALTFDLVDVDRLLAAVVDRVDIAAVVDQVMSRLDLDELVRLALARLDLDAAAAQALSELDVDLLVRGAITRIDLGILVEQVLAEIDLTSVVVEKVDLGLVVNDVLDRMDLTQLVMQRVDLASVAEYVVEEIDLPEIIRESTGSIASATVQGIRLQSVDADRAVSRFVDRMLMRRGARRTAAPGEALGERPDDAGHPADQPEQP
jgi:hypothetical protein